jgi:hypothetical protein
VIHDYFILLSFLSLGFLIISTSSYLKARTFLASVTRENNESLRFRRRARIWRQITLIFIFALLFTRLATFIVGPSELLLKGFSSQDYIFYFLICAVLSAFWIIALYFRYLQRYLKPELIEKYQEKLAIYQIVLVVVDLLVSGFYFLKGYTGLFEPSASAISQYSFVNPKDSIYLISIVLVFLAVLIIFYLLFVFMRSLRFLTQYLILFVILLSACAICAFAGSLQFLGWYESLELNLKLLSWQYGYLGWIYLFFWGTSIFTVSATLIILITKNSFLDASRIRLVILPLVKTGFVSVLAYALLTIMPVLLNVI